MPLGGLAHPHGIEIGAFEEDVGRIVADTRRQPAEDAADAHRTFGRTDHQVAVAQFALHAVERHERRSLGAGFHDDPPPLDLTGVEGVQRLAELEENVVGDVHQIVFGMNARRTQRVLHPVGRRADLAARDRHARIAGRGLRVFDRDADLQRMIVDRERRHVGPQHPCLRIALSAQIGRQIARHADMRSCIDAVGRQTDADQVVVLDMQILLGRHPDRRIGGQLHDTVVRRADPQLVLGAEHSERLHAADLAALDLERLVASFGVEHGTHRCAEHFESLAAVGGAADDPQGLRSAHVDRRYVQMIRIGMLLAGEHFAHDDALQAAAHGLDLLERLHLQTDVREDSRHRLGRQVGGDVLFQPVVRDIHIVSNFLSDEI